MRWVDLEGCASFRDLGGYAAADRQRTKWSVVYRAGALEGTTPSDAERLAELHLRTVVDLRTDRERPEKATDVGAAVVRIPSANPGSASFRRGEYDPIALYLADLEQRGRDFVTLLTVLADLQRLPALIQCSGGKDRTGMMVAMLLSVLGVSDDVIAQEYALSDFEARDPAGYQAALQRVRDSGLDPAMLRSRPETMHGFLDGVAARSGGAEALARSSGASTAVIGAVRRNLLEAF